MKGTKTTLILLLSAFVASATAVTGEDFNGLPIGGFKAPKVAPKSSWFSWLPSRAGITQGFMNFGSSAKKHTTSFGSKVASYIPVDAKTAGIYGSAIGAGLATGYAIQKGVIGKTGRVVKAGYQKTVNGIKAVNQKYPKAKWAGLATGVVTAAGLGVLAYRNPELVTSAFDIAKTVGSKVADIAVKASNLVVDNKYPAATFAGSAVAVPAITAMRKGSVKARYIKALQTAVQQDMTNNFTGTSAIQTVNTPSEYAGLCSNELRDYAIAFAQYQNNKQYAMDPSVSNLTTALAQA